MYCIMGLKNSSGTFTWPIFDRFDMNVSIVGFVCFLFVLVCKCQGVDFIVAIKIFPFTRDHRHLLTIFLCCLFLAGSVNLFHSFYFIVRLTQAHAPKIDAHTCIIYALVCNESLSTNIDLYLDLQFTVISVDHQYNSFIKIYYI